MGDVQLTVSGGRWGFKRPNGSRFFYDPEDHGMTEAEALAVVNVLEGASPTRIRVRPERLDLLVNFDTGAELYVYADRDCFSKELLDNDEYASCWEVSNHYELRCLCVGPNRDYRVTDMPFAERVTPPAASQ